MSVYHLEMFLAASKRKLSQQWLNLKEPSLLTKQEAYKLSIRGSSSKLVMPSRSWPEKEWHPTPTLLPGKSHGQRSLVGCSLWGQEESNMTERLNFHFHALEKGMATHSSVLAWRIPGKGGLVGCRLWGHTESDTTEAT